MVGVDDENRTCVLGQGVLRSDCKETFQWFLESYETAAGGRRPKVRGVAAHAVGVRFRHGIFAVSGCVSLPGCPLASSLPACQVRSTFSSPLVGISSLVGRLYSFPLALHTSIPMLAPWRVYLPVFDVGYVD